MKTCIKCGINKPDDEYYFKSGTDKRRVNTCIDCWKKQSKKRYHENKEYIAEKAAAYRDKNRGILRQKNRANRIKYRSRVERFKTPCVICGENWLPAIAFHHINPAEKSFRLSQSIAKRTDEELQHEASKCISLCMTCHQKYHTNHPSTVLRVDELVSARKSIEEVLS